MLDKPYISIIGGFVIKNKRKNRIEKTENSSNPPVKASPSISPLSADKKEKGEKSEKKKRTTKIVIAIIIIIILLLIAVSCMHEAGMIRYPWEPKGIVSGKAGKLPQKGSIKPSDLPKPDSSVITINTRPKFETASSEGSIMIENPEGNKYDMRLEIYLGTEKETLLYRSGTIKPGYYIDYDYLRVELSKGTHEARAYVTFYDGEKAGNTTSFDLIITILN